MYGRLAIGSAICPLAPGQPASLLPVLLGRLGQLRQPSELSWRQAQGGRRGITLKLLDRDGSGEHDVHPRIGERRRDAIRSWDASRPLASASLTITPQPAACASASAGPVDGSSRFQVACTDWNGLTPSISTCRARRITSACRGPLTERPIASPLARRMFSFARTPRSSRTPLSSVAEWI